MTRRGLEFIHGETDGGSTDNTVVYERHGDVDETPREVERRYYDELLQAAVA